MNFKAGDIIELKKAHPCSPNSKYWKIIEFGADVKMACVNCGHVIIMKRWDFETKVVGIKEENN